MRHVVLGGAVMALAFVGCTTAYGARATATRMPVRVWIASWTGGRHHDAAPGADFVFAVVHAVRDWNAVAAAVQFRVVGDSAAADVHIRWTDRVSAEPGRASHDADGRSGVAHDARTGAITDVTITLSELDAAGVTLTPRDVHAVAVHELGHALGLAHTERVRADERAARSVMAPRTASEEVAEVDRLALRLWYTLPVGASCADVASDRTRSP